jgi:hypothetical protein
MSEIPPCRCFLVLGFREHWGREEEGEREREGEWEGGRES